VRAYESRQEDFDEESFLNIRVADIRAAYDEWRRRGAKFLTPPSSTRIPVADAEAT
jgi:hypothetical protein